MAGASIAVVAYDPDWPRRFDAECAVLEGVLAPWLEGGIHHIGSTAVPGLASKPIVDMMAGVADLEEARAAVAPLREASYEHSFHRPGTHWFYKPPSPRWWERTFGLHLTEPGSDLWRERLAFRDALRADAALAAEYEALKRRLAAEHPEAIGEYTAAKRAFVARVLASAGIELRPRASAAESAPSRPRARGAGATSSRRPCA